MTGEKFKAMDQPYRVKKYIDEYKPVRQLFLSITYYSKNIENITKYNKRKVLLLNYRKTCFFTCFGFLY